MHGETVKFKKLCIEFRGLTVVKISAEVIWDVSPCSLIVC